MFETTKIKIKIDINLILFLFTLIEFTINPLLYAFNKIMYIK